MKNIYYLLPFLLFVSCKTIRPIYPFPYDYNESVYYKIDKVEEATVLNTGAGKFYPDKGEKVVVVFFTFTNKTMDKQFLFLENTYLLDANGRKHRAEFLIASGVTRSFARIDPKIGPGETYSRKIIYSFPKNMRVNKLLVNDKEIQIKYKP
jgi:hypothetical protein